MSSLVVPAEVTLALADFLAVVQRLKATPVAGRAARARLRPAPEGLRFEAGEVTVTLRAQGVWRIDATVPRRHLLRFAELPARLDPLPLRVAGKRLFIGDGSLPCRWRLVGRDALAPPPQTSLAELVAMSEGLDLDSVADGELRGRLIEARQQVRQAISHAADALAPFGVGEFDLRTLVRRKLRSGSTRRPPRRHVPAGQLGLFAGEEPPAGGGSASTPPGERPES